MLCRRAMTVRCRSRRGSSSAAPPPTRGRVCCSRRRTCTSRWTHIPGRRSASSATRKHSRRCSQLSNGWGSISAGREVYPTEALHGALDGLRLDGTSAVLVEFPGWWLDVDDAVGLTWAACERIDAEGLVPVLAHPERCPAVAAAWGAETRSGRARALPRRR